MVVIVDQHTLNDIDEGIRLIVDEMRFQKGKQRIALADTLGKIISARVSMRMKKAEKDNESKPNADVKLNAGVSSVLTDKDLHCVSRLIQSAMFAENGNTLYGCRYCKYGLECKDNTLKREELYDTRLRKKLQELTGVDLSSYQPEDLEKKFYPASFQDLYPKEYAQLLQE